MALAALRTMDDVVTLDRNVKGEPSTAMPTTRPGQSSQLQDFVDPGRQLSFADFDVPPRPADRLFFAVFPDANAATQIAELTRALVGRHGVTGKPLSPERLHITLNHLGDYIGLPQGVVAAATAAGATIDMQAFDVTFDRVMSFSGRRDNLPIVLRGGEGLAGLMTFQQVLGGAMMKAELGRWVDRRFTPHVTLLYGKGKMEEETIEPIRWTVREFVLIHSLLGRGQYIPLGRWPLRADGVRLH